MLVTTGSEVDAPEDVVDCLIEPVRTGRSDSEAVAPGLMWSPETGIMSLKAYSQKLDLAEQQKKLKADQEAMAARKAKEARERASRPSKKDAKVARVADKPADMGKELEL